MILNVVPDWKTQQSVIGLGVIGKNTKMNPTQVIMLRLIF